MAFLDNIESIFTGGLQTALDIEAEKARADLSGKSLTQDNVLARKDDSGMVYASGTKPSLVPAGVSPVMWIGGGLIAVMLVVLLLRRG